MSMQDANRRDTRVVRVNKRVADKIDGWAEANGVSIREVMDAIVEDFMLAAPGIREHALKRWLRDGRVAARRIRSRLGPQSVAAWERMVREANAARALRQGAEDPEASPQDPED